MEGGEENIKQANWKGNCFVRDAWSGDFASPISRLDSSVAEVIIMKIK